MRSHDELERVWRELVEQSDGDLHSAMRELRKITDPTAEGDLETFREGLALLGIAHAELDRDWYSRFGKAPER